MKTLKFDHDLAVLILSGKKTSTWRLYDDKDLSVNDNFNVVDKVDPKDPSTWEIVGRGRITEIIEKNLGDVNSKDMEGHDSFESKEGMLKEYQNYYGQNVDYKTPVKIIFFEFSPGQAQIATGGMLLEEAKVYTDGGSRGNPGESACAYAICKMDDSVVEKSGFYIGIATNNQAEYAGFAHGLERARQLDIKRITLMSDSQLVVNQMKGIYKVKNQELAPLHKEVADLARSFEHINFVYVPRELNRIADAEVNRILDEHERTKKNHRH